MGTNATTRIAERTRIADLHLGEQNWFGRAANRMGLFIANTVDRITGWADNDRVVFAGATAAGLWRGAAYGVLATILIAAFVSLGSAAVPLLFTLMAVGAVGYGIYDGQKGLEHHLNKGDPKFADSIAKKFGAVPGKTIHVTKHPEVTVKTGGRDPTPENQTEATLSDPANAVSFVKSEDLRRSAAATTIGAGRIV